MTQLGRRLGLMDCGPAIRKDDPAKHLDKLIAAGDGRKTRGIVAPLELARAEKMQHTI